MSNVSPASPAAEPTRPLDPLLRPRGVAIVGASADPTKRGYQIIRSLQDSGYQGGIYPVNPRGGQVLGIPVYESIATLPVAPDLAVLCTPATSAPDILEQCMSRGIRGAVILALGFGEAGTAGETLEARVREIAGRGIRIVGPNTSGLLNRTIGLDLIGLRDVPAGRLGIIAQSGNMVLELVRRATAERGEGLALCVGLGNMADVAWHHVLDDMGRDEAVAAILMYAEGFEYGRAFVDAAARVSAVKPIALLAAGRSAAGSRASRSHTGALASRPPVLRAALRAAGVIQLERSDELAAVGTTLVRQPAARQGGLAILSDGGGHAALAADTCVGLGVSLATLSPAIRRSLSDLLGTTATVENPVDVAGATDREPGRFSDAVDLLLRDQGVGAVLLVGLFGGYGIRFSDALAASEADAGRSMAAAARRAGRPLVVHSIYHGAESEALDALRAAGVPVIGSLEVACRAAAALFERRRGLDRRPRIQVPEPARRGTEWIRLARAEKRVALIETEARSLLAAYGVSLIPAELCTTPEEAADAAARADGAVAVRLVSGTILHKTEAGGVRLGVVGGDMAAEAFQEIREAATEYAAARAIDPDVRGALISPMATAPSAELIIGARRDPSFGPLLAVGFGGTGVEALGDASLRLLPTVRDEILSALGELRGAPLLGGPRGRPVPDLDAVAELAMALADCLLDNPALSDVEANPVFSYPDRALAVDVRALLAPDTAERAAADPASPGDP